MADPQRFTEFWSYYPRRVARLAAERAWRKVPDAEIEKVFSGLAVYLHYEWRGREISFVPHASTWLNQRRWEDGAELEASHNGSRGQIRTRL